LLGLLSKDGDSGFVSELSDGVVSSIFLVEKLRFLGDGLDLSVSAHRLTALVA
jgi:hypothetical protein